LKSQSRDIEKTIANPCGLIAKTFFNDTFFIKGVDLREDGIAWDTDEQKFNSA